MKKTLLSLLAASQLFNPAFADNSPVVGDWQGALQLGPRSMKMIVHISDPKDQLTVTLDSPDKGKYGLVTDSASYSDGTLTFSEIKRGMTFKGKLVDGQIVGAISQRGMSLPLVLHPAASEKEANTAKDHRPQTPKGPFPYEVKEVRFDNKAAGITLAGSLTLPKKVNSVAILISGSGQQNRDSEMAGHKPFLVLADHLSRRGIAVLRFDERGIGDSQGDFKSSTSADFGQDVAAAFEFLRAYPGLPHDSIGLIGHSEGGFIAPRVAAKQPKVAFTVLLGGPYQPLGEIVVEQDVWIGRVEGVSEQLLQQQAAIDYRIYPIIKNADDLSEVYPKVLALTTQRVELEGLAADLSAVKAEQLAKKLTTPWNRYFLNQDPLEAVLKLKKPVLALNGTVDWQVHVKNLDILRQILIKTGHPDFTVEAVAGVNHLFQEDKTGSIHNYALNEQTFSPRVLNRISDWVNARF